MSALTDQYRLLYERGRVMEHIRQYLLSFTAAAVICSLIISLTGEKSTYASIIKMLCGLFMAVTMISPLIQMEWSDFSFYYGSIITDADAAVANGEQMANEAAAGIIKQKTQTYILDKALSMGLDIDVEVLLADPDTLYPYKVLLQGDASPYARQKLKEMIANDLGIPEENQIWI